MRSFTVSQKMSPELQFQTTNGFILAVAICDQNLQNLVKVSQIYVNVNFLRAFLKKKIG